MNLALLGHKKSVFLIFLLALLVRFYQLDIPFLEPFNSLSRQSICAQVARNFYERGFNLFYPEVDINGNGPSLYNAEMPFYSWLMALGYALVGGVKHWAARSVTVFFSMFFLWHLYRLAKDEYGRYTALWALVIASFSPLSLALSRSIQPDMTMLALMTAAIYWARRYSKGGRDICLGISGVLLFFAAATKIFAYLAIPVIFYLFWQRDRKKIVTLPKYYGYALIAGAALGWYAWMWYLGKTVNLGYQPLQYYHGEESSVQTYLSFWRFEKIFVVMKVFVLHHLTLPGLVVWLVGMFSIFKQKTHCALVVWGLGTLAYSLIFWPYLVKHGYYQLPWLAWIAIVAALGVETLRKRSFLLAGLLLLAALNAAYYYPKIYTIPPEIQKVRSIGLRADELLPANALVVGAYGSSPAQVYYNHRRGWSLSLGSVDGEGMIKELRGYQERGAEYFVTSQSALLAQRPLFFAYLQSHGREIYRSADGVIYNLI